MPWPPVAAVLMFVPGVIVWAVFALRCQAHTLTFFTTVAPVPSETIDGVASAVETTLYTVIIGGSFIFILALILAVARRVQENGQAPDCMCPCGELLFSFSF